MKRLAPVCIAGLMAGCGTTYEVASLQEPYRVAANDVIAIERAKKFQRFSRSDYENDAMLLRVRDQMEPIMEEACRDEVARQQREGVDCDFTIGISWEMQEDNAFHTTTNDGVPLVVFSGSFMNAIANDDELAFIMGHEAGHHIADHIGKQEDQREAGMIAMGLLMGLAQAYAAQGSYGNPTYNSYAAQQRRTHDIQNAMVVGNAIGGGAYSQTYELEADILGAYIVERAGYDPEKGALVFARLSDEEGSSAPSGVANFWSTHPSSPERIGMVKQTAAEIAAERAAGKSPAPPKK